MLISFEFLKQHHDLSWGELLWGYERHLVGWTALVDFAVQRIESGSENDLELELAGVDKSLAHEVGELLRKLANPIDGEIVKAKWLCIVLAWAWQTRERAVDPLAEVENIYAEFGYPKEIAGFVRYMPTTDGYDPSAHSKEQNEARLYEKWKAFLDSCWPSS